MKFFASDVHRQHHGLELDDGALVRSYEGPDRADLIANALTAAGHELSPPGPLDLELVGRVHAGEYIEFLQSAWTRWAERIDHGPAAMGFTWPTRGLHAVRPDDLIGQLGFHSFAADCSIVAGTWEAAASAASIATSAAHHLVQTGDVSFGLCRPPGHHATRDQFGGYCYLNNAAIAAQHLRDSGMERVAVLDVDYHHGNGTQAIFWDRSDVLFVSLHADPKLEFPWFAGHASEVGAHGGEGWNVNLPLPYGVDMAMYAEALNVACDRIVDASVDAVVVSLGVDTYVDDPLGQFRLTTADFARIATRIAAMKIPMIVLQEGGYATEAIGTNVASFLEPLS